MMQKPDIQLAQSQMKMEFPKAESHQPDLMGV